MARINAFNMSCPPILRAALEKINVFNEFNDNELNAFVELAEYLEVEAGACIVRQDEPGDCMYIIVKGDARVIHRKDERRFELAVLHPGDFFGELALVDEGPRSADVEAIGPCSLIRLPQSVVRALAGVYPSAAFKLLVGVGRVLVARMRAGNQKYIDSLLIASRGKD